MRIDKGFNLYVDVATACNAACPFCIAPTVGRENGEGFLEGLKWALDFTQYCYGSVQVTGGEPTLNRRLPEVIRAIAQRMFHRVVLNTNGSGIKEPSIVIDLEAAGFTHVNLSRHHYIEERNQEVMRFNRVADATDESFVRAVELVQRSGMMPRINCNLLRGYIDSEQEIEKFVSWCAGFGVFNIAFSETFPLDLLENNLPIVSGYAESHAVDLALIVADLDRKLEAVKESPEYLSSMWGQSQWISSFVVGGHRRFWNTPNGGRISVKTLAGWNADGSPKPPTYSKAADIELQDGELCFAVVHPDGAVSASWDKRERVLFAPQMATVELEELK